MRRIRATVVVVGIIAFASGMVVGGRTSGFLSRKQTPESAAPSFAPHVHEALNLGPVLIQCKPPNAVLVSDPPAIVASPWSNDESNLPVVSAAAEWVGPTDILEVRNTFLRVLRTRCDGRDLVCYGPGIRAADDHPEVALEMLRCDTLDGSCVAMVALAIHIRGDRCRVTAQLIPARPWRPR